MEKKHFRMHKQQTPKRCIGPATNGRVASYQMPWIASFHTNFNRLRRPFFLTIQKKKYFLPLQEYNILAIVCHSTESVHLQVVKEVNTANMLFALSCFTAGRGMTEMICSDYGLAFHVIQAAISGNTTI
jgi:uncharacterized pyridoxamine 5'-phosphate oxidase family protein